MYAEFLQRVNFTGWNLRVNAVARAMQQTAPPAPWWGWGSRYETCLTVTQTIGPRRSNLTLCGSPESWAEVLLPVTPWSRTEPEVGGGQRAFVRYHRLCAYTVRAPSFQNRKQRGTERFAFLKLASVFAKREGEIVQDYFLLFPYFTEHMKSPEGARRTVIYPSILFVTRWPGRCI